MFSLSRYILQGSEQRNSGYKSEGAFMVQKLKMHMTRGNAMRWCSCLRWNDPGDASIAAKWVKWQTAACANMSPVLTHLGKEQKMPQGLESCHLWFLHLTCHRPAPVARVIRIWWWHGGMFTSACKSAFQINKYIILKNNFRAIYVGREIQSGCSNFTTWQRSLLTPAADCGQNVHKKMVSQ